MQTWRLILDAAAEGTWNMAVDAAMLDAYRSGQAPPTLRIYDWIVPTVSLGYAQLATDVDMTTCRERGVAVVRRPTGGRAVLHGQGDLTYAVVASEAEGFPASVSGAYRHLARGFVEALRQLGLDAALEAGERTAPGSAACFATATRADLVARGHKLIGSAQLRQEGGFVQHGAIMIRQTPEELASLLARGEARAAMTHLEVELGRRVERPELEAALTQGLARALDLRFEAGPLSPIEADRARQWQARYAIEGVTTGPGARAAAPAASSGTSSG